ncbi:MAG: SulP family inorganic anion transporter [Alphaproteobacteria bacterium]|nr:SulP family inorganic anion transporter [Alphaproteobacteria bacterium]
MGAQLSLSQKLFPAGRWIGKVDSKTLTSDLMAGLTGALVVLPQGVAFATIAGMPPEYGLYAGMVPAIVAALFGSSWHLVSGPTTAASLVLFSGLSALAEPGSPQYVQLALTLTFMVGIIELVMGLAKLGTLVNFISHSVVLGFTAGAAILIGANQVKNFFGVPIPRGAHFHEILFAFAKQISHINPYVTGIALLTVLTGLAFRRFLPRFPYMIGALMVATMTSMALNHFLGASHTGIVTVGALPASLPPLSMPHFTMETIRQLAPVTIAATLFALTEAVSIARAIAVRSGQQIDGNQEFIGQGLSNIFGSFFSAYVATGSFNRSGLNYESGAKTPLAAVFAGFILAVVVALVAPWAAYLPNAAMAGVLFLVAWGLIDFHHIHQVLRTSRSETAILGVTFLSTLFLELEVAIMLGIILSLVVYLSRTSRPRIVTRLPDPQSPTRKFTSDHSLPECSQVKIIRIDGSLFFGAVNYMQETLRAIEHMNPTQNHLIIIANGINFIDIAGAEAMVQEAQRYRAKGGGLYLIRAKAGVRGPLESGGYVDDIGRENIFSSKGQAIATVYSKLDKTKCQRCSHSVFNECHGTSHKINEVGKQA